MATGLAAICLIICSAATAAPKKVGKAPAADEEVETLEVQPTASSDHSDWFSEGEPIFDRVMDHLTARTSRPQTFNSLVAHRNNQGVFVAPLRDLLGFDGGGLKIALALRYGIIEDLDVGVARQNGTVEVFDTYEFDVRYRLLDQRHKHPCDLALRLGLSWFEQPNKDDASGFFAQLLLDRIFVNRALIGGGFVYHSNSTGPTKGDADVKGTAALLLHADVRLVDSLALDLEVAWALSGFKERYPVITFGPKIVTNRHTFSFVLSNSQYMLTDGLITNTYRIGLKEWVFGFHITREIG